MQSLRYIQIALIGVLLIPMVTACKRFGWAAVLGKAAELELYVYLAASLSSGGGVFSMRSSFIWRSCLLSLCLWSHGLIEKSQLPVYRNLSSLNRPAVSLFPGLVVWHFVVQITEYPRGMAFWRLNGSEPQGVHIKDCVCLEEVIFRSVL